MDFVRRYGSILLLGFTPAAILLDLFAPERSNLIFFTAIAAILPLAGYIGWATEHLAARLGGGIGGLLNATFGNAAELIIAVLALHEGLPDLVKASITGSIIGNVLLVFGASALAGGVRHSVQRFNRTAAGMGTTMLLLSAIGLVVPAAFHRLAEGSGAAPDLQLDTEIAVVLLLTYALSLLFTLKTHRQLYGLSHQVPPDSGRRGADLRADLKVRPYEEEHDRVERDRVERDRVERDRVEQDRVEQDRVEEARVVGADLPPTREATVDSPKPRGGGQVRPGDNAAESDTASGLMKPVLVLLAATAGVAVVSELLVGAVSEAAPALGMSQLFVGVVVIALVGNAAEHYSAIVMAWRNDMDTAIAIAVGSSTQIALFVAPVLVFLSYVIGPAPMDLIFTTFEVVAIALSVLTISFIAHDGETHWMEGVQLLAVYVILCLGFYLLPVP